MVPATVRARGGGTADAPTSDDRPAPEAGAGPAVVALTSHHSDTAGRGRSRTASADRRARRTVGRVAAVNDGGARGGVKLDHPGGYKQSGEGGGLTDADTAGFAKV